MANFIYGKAKQAFAAADLDWDAHDIKWVLVRGYTPNASTHEFISDVTGGGGGTLVAESANLGSKTNTLGVLDAADPAAISGVAAGAAIPHLILFRDTGSAATDRLIACYDTGTGLPLTPDGNNIQITHDNGSNKILAL